MAVSPLVVMKTAPRIGLGCFRPIIRFILCHVHSDNPVLPESSIIRIKQDSNYYHHVVLSKLNRP